MNRHSLGSGRPPETPAERVRRARPTNREPSLVHAFAGRHGTLLASLLLLLIAAPWLIGNDVLGWVADVMVGVVMLSSVRAASSRRRSLVIASVLTAATFATRWGMIEAPGRGLLAVNYTLALLTLAYAAVTILTAIVRSTDVTADTIRAAISVYLLIGLAWALLFAVMNLLNPDAFLFHEVWDKTVPRKVRVEEQLADLLYFSFSTLTTLGYGDILPHTPQARMVCYLEAIGGQFYLTVLIARLVGMHIARGVSSDDTPETKHI